MGERISDDRIRICGRVKFTTKLAQGVFVSLEAIEMAMSNCPLVSEIVVHADASKSYVVALVKPQQSNATERDVLAEMREEARRAGLAPFELPRGVVLLDESIARNRSLLTNTGKVQRRKIEEHFRKQLDDKYAEIDSRAAATTANSALVNVLNMLGQDEAPDLDKLSFKALGGDSILALRVAKSLGVDAAALLSDAPLAEVLARTSEGSNDNDNAVLSTNAPSLAAVIDSLRNDIASRSISSESADKLPSKSRRTVVLSGANGFLGAHLLQELVQRTEDDRPIVALVRAKDNDAARARLSKALKALRLPELDLTNTSRVRVLAADMSVKHFGLDDDAFRALCNETQLVIHNAAPRQRSFATCSSLVNKCNWVIMSFCCYYCLLQKYQIR